MVQEAKAASEPPEKEIVVPPAGALIIPSKHEVVRIGTSAMVTPAGRLSVKARLVTTAAELLVMVKVSRLLLPGPIVAGVKLLLKSGWADRELSIKTVLNDRHRLARCWWKLVIRFTVT
jgi:hypothetical protein